MRSSHSAADDLAHRQTSELASGNGHRTPERAPLVSTKAGMIAEHRTDAVEQEPATNHARRCRCSRAEKRSARTKGRAHSRCQTGTRRIGRSRCGCRLCLGARRWYRASRVALAEDLVAHAAQESTLLLRPAGSLRLQLLDPRIGALERLRGPRFF